MAKSKASKSNGRRIVNGTTRASQRVARAVELGLQSWVKRRKKSAKKRRDGALRDALQNAGFAAGRTFREASWASSDFFGALGRRRDPRRLFLRAILPL
jgi:hypothetical protein